MSNDFPPPPPPPEGGLPSYGSSAGTPGPAAAGFGQYPGEHMPPQQNSQALWSLILGVLAFFLCGIFTGIPAMILASNAKKSIAASNGQQTGAGMATAGFWLGLVATVLTVLGIIAVVFLIASGGLAALTEVQ